MLDTVFIPFIPELHALGTKKIISASCHKNADGKVDYSSTQGLQYDYFISPNLGSKVDNNSFRDLPKGTYHVFAENSQGCIGRDTINIGILNDRQFSYSTTNSSNIHCYGSVVFEARGGIGDYTYSISPDNVREESSGHYDGLCWGDYTLTAIDSAGCSISKKIKISEDLSAPENMFKHFTIYPNPANNEVWLKSDYLFQYDVSIINTMGQVLLKKSTHDKLTRLDVSSLSPGMYLLRFKSDVDHHERKLLIQH